MYDLIIIGSGPAGLSASIYAKRANLKSIVIEKEYEGTGQIAYSEKVDNYPGLPGISGYDLGEKIREHALSFGVEFIDGEVTAITKGEDSNKFAVSLGPKASLCGRAVVYAAGSSNRKLEVKGEDKFFGKGISTCAVCDGSFYKDKTVAVVGGGNTAIDDALYLSDIAKKVYLIHRRETFKAAVSTLEKLKAKENVEFILGVNVNEFIGDKKLSAISLDSGQTIDIDGAFLAVGQVPNTDILKGFVDLDEAGFIIADETTKSSVEGFYAAGDVRTKNLRQLVTALSDGANALISALEYLG